MFQYLFSFKGRINRAKMWLFYFGSFFVIGVMMLLENWYGRAEGLGDFFGGRLMWPHTVLGYGIAALLIALTLAYLLSYVAVVLKRLHDRNKSAWWLLLFFGVPIAFFALMLTWPAATQAFLKGAAAGVIAFAVTWLTIAWYFVELFFLRGTAGDNRFGPDPIAAKK